MVIQNQWSTLKAGIYVYAHKHAYLCIIINIIKYYIYVYVILCKLYKLSSYAYVFRNAYIYITVIYMCNN